MKWTVALIGSLLMLAPVACQVPEAPMIANGQTALPKEDSAAYLDRISSRPTVTEADALAGIFLMLDEPPKATFGEAVKALVGRKIADARWDFQAGREMVRGKVAYMIYQTCKIRGGLTLTLAGPSQRYCLRELQYRGFMTPGPVYNIVTGMEYVAILARADELRQTGKVTSTMVREVSW